MNVLITSASRKVNLVKEFQLALGLESGGNVVAVDTVTHSAALYFADRHYLVPRGPGLAFFEVIDEICARENISLVIPTRDEELVPFALRRDEMRGRGTEVMVAPPDVIENCQDKPRFVRFCAANGFDTPATIAARDIHAFPVFVKYRFGKGGVGARRIDTREQLDCCLADQPDLMIQEFVEAPEFTIDLFSDFSASVLTTVVRERLKVFGGESFVGRTRRDPQIVDECTRLAESLGLIGHNTIQCFLDRGRVRFIEVNPRFGGGAALGFAAGVSTPRILIKLINGSPIEAAVGEFEDGLVMLRYTVDCFLRRDGTVIR